MSIRKVVKQTYGEQFKMGPLKVRQPLPVAGLEQVSPFILLHHAGPTEHQPNGMKERLSPHPHRGFEPVTFLFSGKLHHKDSAGHEGFLESGDVQWMTSGSGIIHSEGPSTAFASEGGDMEIIQLWVNLPRDHKMTKPRYQDIKKETIPTLQENGFTMNIVAGDYKGHKGPASTFTPIVAMMVHFKSGASTIIKLPKAYNVIAYVLDGTVESNGSK